ncbi:hypothetical protein U8469_004644, partial [Salmonella enterica]|nr:hypothetical protein [Salmonella enterica]
VHRKHLFGQAELQLPGIRPFKKVGINPVALPPAVLPAAEQQRDIIGHKH